MDKISVSITLKRPNPKENRRHWQFLRVVRINGKRTYESYPSPLLNQINKLWDKKLQTFEQLDKQAVDLQRKLTRVEKGLSTVTFNEENLVILGSYENPAPGSYWHDIYGRRTKLIDRSSSYYDLRRAMEAVGTLSILTATERELQAFIERHNYPSNKQRRVVTRLTQLLKFVGRPDVKLEKDKKKRRVPKYITETELTQLLEKIENPALKALCGMAWYSGCRQGELFAINPLKTTETYTFVEFQLDETLELRELKGGADSARKSYLLPGFHEFFKKWVSLPDSDKKALRTKRLAELVKEAAIRAFPGQSEKHIVFHDLRHSYAVELLRRGVPMSFVARSLGNTESVCEAYYLGFQLNDGFIEAINSILKVRA